MDETVTNAMLELLADTAGALVTDLVENYDIHLGPNQIALVHRPTSDVVEIYKVGVPMTQLMTDLVKHAAKVMHEEG